MSILDETMKSMGFKLTASGDYEARFFDDCTGSIIKIVGKEESDNGAVPRLQFYGFDERGRSLGPAYTLDQIMNDYSRHYTPVPEKSNKKYVSYYTLNVQVPVDMSEISEKIYYENMGVVDSEIQVAQNIASERLKNLFIYNSMNVLDFAFVSANQVK